MEGYEICCDKSGKKISTKIPPTFLGLVVNFGHIKNLCDFNKNNILRRFAWLCVILVEFDQVCGPLGPPHELGKLESTKRLHECRPGRCGRDCVRIMSRNRHSHFLNIGFEVIFSVPNKNAPNNFVSVVCASKT